MFSPPRGAADEPSKPRPKAIGRGAMLARKKGGTSQPVNSTPPETSSPPPPAISEPTTPPPGRVAKLAKIKYPKIVRNFYDFLPNFLRPKNSLKRIYSCFFGRGQFSDLANLILKIFHKFKKKL